MNTQVFLGLGSNLGDRLEMLRRALDAIDALDTTTVLAVSRAVESEPWGVTDQPSFANAVARIGTALPADRLLGLLQEIEVGLGREKTARYGPRAIDIDIVLYGDDEWDTPELVVPHPRFAERDFVVTPLLEVDPEVRWPDGTPVTRDGATQGRVTGVLGAVPGYEDRTPVVSAGVWETPIEGPWEEVAATRFSVSGGLTYSTELRFDAAVLEQEGIPYAWDPLPPAEEYNLYLMPRTYRLLVPERMAAHARTLLAEVRAGRIIDPEADFTED
ncbi:MAG: 2-amino-4-hydroxy-6-hydroxymethyldihydropteridine diphosphokinase [Coriobacteriia bacterium]|nr:2-amino-4-hydroxy-6-hydroxymethyldihydropteridine diphosphokinase [Coriobacteriia bacterium]